MSDTNNPSIFAVVTIEFENGDVEREFLINYSHHETKLWLTRTQVWALTNERVVYIQRASESDIASKKQFIPTK